MKDIKYFEDCSKAEENAINLLSKETLNRILKQMDMNTFPRRSRIDLLTPAEKAISDAMAKVEEMEADVRLTNAVIKLQEAQDLVADYVDSH